MIDVFLCDLFVACVIPLFAFGCVSDLSAYRGPVECLAWGWGLVCPFAIRMAGIAASNLVCCWQDRRIQYFLWCPKEDVLLYLSILIIPPTRALVPLLLLLLMMTLIMMMMKMLALKVVKVDNGVENAEALMDNYSNEIELLKSLQGNRFIINLENSEVPLICHSHPSSTKDQGSAGTICSSFTLSFW